MNELRLRISHRWDGTALPASETVDIALSNHQDGGLSISVDAPWWAGVTPSQQTGRLAKLWEHDVVEVFLVGRDGRYLEVELGPHGHYLALHLSAPRMIDNDRVPVSYTVRRQASRWHGYAMVRAQDLPLEINRINAFAIHGRGENRRFNVAYPLPGPRPDFHQPDHFPLTSTLI